MILAVAAILYNFGLVAGAAYLVVKHNWSPWTMALPLLFGIGSETIRSFIK
jgi:hypothetical protein